MEDINKIRKKIQKEAEKHIEIDESDIPVHEKLVKPSNESEIGFGNSKNFQKEEHIKKIKRK